MSTTGVEKIVERQMRNWELARSQRDGGGGAPARRVFEFFTISRQKSSGGSAVAHALGQRTGWQVYDQEILNYMAHNDAVQQRIYELADEHAEGYLESILKNLGFDGLPPGSDYFRKLVNSIHVIAHGSHAVFVGRGVNFILPAERSLRARVIAPEDVRFERYAEQVRCSLKDAATVVREQDASRDRFVRDHFRVDASAPEHYDLVINTGMVSIDAAVGMLVAGLEGKTRIRIAAAG